MTLFIVRRFIQTVIVIFIVTLLVFMIMRSMPGDPVVLFLGPDASKEQITYFTQEFGLDQPLPVQYIKWLGNILKGEFGKSIAYRQDIGPFILERLKVTLMIAIPAFIISVIVGVLLGVAAAVKRGGLVDSIITVMANLGMATPIFWLSILCVYIFSLKLGWLPVQGFTWPTDNFSLSIHKMIMPVFILSLGPLAQFARQARSAMLEVIRQDYIRTGRSKGLGEKTIIFKHALRNALIPIITLMGMQLGYMIGGSVLIEQVFVIPGMGNMLITAILNKDYQLVQSGVFMIATGVSLCNLLVDIAYGYVDPRIRIS
ncbi:ABC transporter permease [Paenibacillus alginolyticus]|uniref:ABC transporter permease n=1 Tax=Paenibacillus alginolyticus TaxID=59839 RepID=A0ABT4GAG0_9BACL|nr:ABC transporter permease [Paenibacillus alginolyticus]MCY9693171.1 ABC transporter permease [Paenibacillus alginolyticus]MEC0144534.1 ABC transporter permease [Paenibacillus alginolyticus]